MTNRADYNHAGRGFRPGQTERNSVVDLPGITRKLQRTARVFVATLREIFDESAYSRFLCMRGLKVSQESYAAFQREQDGIRARRPRCC
jgi:hypothetical protein